MFQLLIVGYVIFEIYRLSNLPDVGAYAPPPPPPQPGAPPQVAAVSYQLHFY
ncbi:unnamed protein product [Anisakis simplex]|uniref:Uncharacterized protein n=1 Tax=Anisakis simplex TaxID=6269 RepID=A0A0M3K930_ANISI|nr:unnamed protein product [Anisakis simplex]